MRICAAVLSTCLLLCCGPLFAGDNALEKALLAQAAQPDSRCVSCQKGCEAGNAVCQPSCESRNFSCHAECGGIKNCREACIRTYGSCVASCETKRDGCLARCPCATPIAVPGSAR